MCQSNSNFRASLPKVLAWDWFSVKKKSKVKVTVTIIRKSVSAQYHDELPSVNLTQTSYRTSLPK